MGLLYLYLYKHIYIYIYIWKICGLFLLNILRDAIRVTNKKQVKSTALNPSSAANVSLVPQSLLFEPQFQTSKLLLLPIEDRGGIVAENKTVCIAENKTVCIAENSIIDSVLPEVSIMLGADKGDVVTSPAAVR